MRQQAIAGLTLIELLVVIVMIGIVSSLVTIHGWKNSSSHEASELSRQLQSSIQIARDQSLSEIRTLGLGIHKTHYEFYEYNNQDNTWTALKSEDNFWKSWSIPTSLTLTLTVEPLDDSLRGKEGSETPQIAFFPDGHFTPFTISIQTDSPKRILQLVGRPDNSIVLLDKP